MAALLQDLITEIENIHSAVSDYADSLGSYIFNGTGAPPVFDTTKLTLDNLLQQAKNNQDSSVDLTSGAVSSMVYKTIGIARELGVRAMTKSMMYDLAVEEASQVTEEVRGESGKTISQLRSMTPPQIEGL